MITVAGLSPSLDVTYLVDSLRLGQIHRPHEVHKVAGGKPLNLARAAATLGAGISTVVVLGGATGALIEEELQGTGIDLRTVSGDAETRTCISIASSDRSDLTEIYERTPGLSEKVWRQFCTQLDNQLAGRAGWLAINGSPPTGLDPNALAELIALAHRAGVRAAVDVSGPSLAAVVAAMPDLVKINRVEATELLSEADGTDLGAMADRIAGRTGGSVVITDGRDGAVGRAPGEAPFRVGVPAGVIGSYPVGSGDSFLAGLLTALDDGADTATAVRHASGCGAANALIPGAGNLDPATARQIAERVVLERVQSMHD